MNSEVISAEQFIDALPGDRKEAMQKLRQTIIRNLPKGFKEEAGSGMLNYVVPHELYPGGYHCNPKQPLPFVSIASQKNFIALYHMGMYAMPEILKWFEAEYPKHSQTKLDMGKSCIRFKKPEQIPFKLIGELMNKISVDEWIRVYESIIKK